MKQKLAIAGLSILCALLAYTNIRGWFKLPSYQTIYRVAPTPYEAKTTRLWNKAEKVLYPCVPVLAEAPPMGADRSTPRAHHIYRGTKGEEQSRQSSANASDPPTLPLLLGEFRIEPLPHGGTVRPELHESGETHLVVTPSPPKLLEAGQLREIALWGDPGLRSPRTWAISYSQDVLRIGPAWLRGRAEYGKLIAHEDIDPHWKAELGIAFRF